MAGPRREPPGTEETWTYVGRRISGERLVYQWLDATRVERAFVKGPAMVIGGRYTVQVKHDEETGGVSVYDSWTRYVDRIDDEDSVRFWTVNDQAAYSADQERRAENRAKKDRSALEGMTLSELREYFGRLPYGQRAGIASWITGYLWGTK